MPRSLFSCANNYGLHHNAPIVLGRGRGGRYCSSTENSVHFLLPWLASSNRATGEKAVNHSLDRRQWLRYVWASGAAAGLAQLGATDCLAAEVGEPGGFQSSIIQKSKVDSNRANARLVGDRVIQPERQLPVLHRTDVLVVGGGSAGVTAAIAAKRAGADVTLVERYGHFGGLWTGGLVLLILGHIVKGGKQVCQGIGEEIMRRLEKLDGAIINRRPGVNPTVDAEAAKYILVEMVMEAKLKVFLQSSKARLADRPSWPKWSSMPPVTATCWQPPGPSTNTARTTWGWSPGWETWTA
jgi:hypothetical protein